jgi:hypothetical protein
MWLWRFGRRDGRRSVTVAVGVGLVPLLAWAPAFFHQYQHKLYAFAGPFSVRDVVYLYARLFGVFAS